LKEQQSGSDQLFDRPVMQELLALCGTGGAGYDTIIVERVDRIARDVVIGELFFRECKEKGVSVYAADSGEELVNASGDPTRILIRQILGALSQWDKAQICKKLQAGRRRVARETGVPCGGPKPFGSNEEGEMSAQSNWILDTIVRYRREGQRSYRWIANWLHLYHVPTPQNAKRWAPGMVHNLFHKNSERVISPDYEIYHRSFLKKFERPAGGDGTAPRELWQYQVGKPARKSLGCDSEIGKGVSPRGD
jgi:DNA invertase Pin-like site-specific DNA recombinase